MLILIVHTKGIFNINTQLVLTQQLYLWSIVTKIVEVKVSTCILASIDSFDQLMLIQFNINPSIEMKNTSGIILVLLMSIVNVMMEQDNVSEKLNGKNSRGGPLRIWSRCRISEELCNETCTKVGYRYGECVSTSGLLFGSLDCECREHILAFAKNSISQLTGEYLPKINYVKDSLVKEAQDIGRIVTPVQDILSTFIEDVQNIIEGLSAYNF